MSYKNLSSPKPAANEPKEEFAPLLHEDDISVNGDRVNTVPDHPPPNRFGPPATTPEAPRLPMKNLK